jgi:hypothetical protein
VPAAKGDCHQVSTLHTNTCNLRDCGTAGLHGSADVVIELKNLDADQRTERAGWRSFSIVVVARMVSSEYHWLDKGLSHVSRSEFDQGLSNFEMIRRDRADAQTSSVNRKLDCQDGIGVPVCGAAPSHVPTIRSPIQ